MKSKNKIKKASHLGTPFGLAYNDLERRRKKGFVTTLEGSLWECAMTENGQHVPLTWREPAKINKLLLAENATTHSQNVKKIYVLQQKFSTYKNQKYKVLK
jgi:hypothetical protein